MHGQPHIRFTGFLNHTLLLLLYHLYTWTTMYALRYTWMISTCLSYTPSWVLAREEVSWFCFGWFKSPSKHRHHRSVKRTAMKLPSNAIFDNLRSYFRVRLRDGSCVSVAWEQQPLVWVCILPHRCQESTAIFCQPHWYYMYIIKHK